ncbi:MAG: hypothetical protein LBQ64_00510 [Bacteroidales bacterium]|jgi:hypothetical protein|nr:hypothetical protein [Bacteroidales bacterium]
MKRFILFLILSSTLFSGAYAQIETRVPRTDSAGLFVFLAPNFTYNFVMADLRKEFGNNFAIGADLAVKMKNNWSIDFGFKYFFGGLVEESVIDSAFKHLTSDGLFIGNNGVAVNDIEVEFRGIAFHLQAGRVIPVTKRYRNSGIWIKMGIGVTQHYMNIKNPENKVLSLVDEYKKGYDRLTIGFSLYQFVGYAHMNRRNLFCLYGGIEFYENFAKRQRAYDFSLMRKDNAKLFETMIGLKIGWIIPLYRHNPNAVFYYR